MSRGEREEEEAKATARAVFARVSWAVVLPRLARGARHYLRTLGWAEGSTHRPAAMEERELVNTAYDRFASGQWTLPVALCATDDGVVRVLSKAMFHVAMDRARHLAVAGWGDDAVDEHADDTPTPSRRSHERLVIERLEQLFQGDPEALSVLGGFAEGILDRDDIREQTGWSAEHLKVVLRRMARRGRSARLTPYDDGEAEPPSSGPHRRDDGTPQAGGRQGSPPEHDRRAGDAGRRR